MNQKFLKMGVMAILGLISLQSSAQLKCTYDEHHEKALLENPAFAKQENDFQAYLKHYLANNSNQKDDKVYIIPVVFHLVHQYGSENITDQQVLDAMEVLNRDFRAVNPDTAQIVPAFKNLIGDAKIEFRLATIDPDGNCTTGIDRLVSQSTHEGGDEARYNAWDYYKYFNIWICDNLGGAAGYSYAYDVAMRSDYMGRIGTAGEYGSRALTHEVGHWASLPHIWGNTAPGTECGNDGIDDTPITKGFLPGSVACDKEQSVCIPPIVENHQNYMDYAYCQRMFTPGQVANMRARLNQPGSTYNSLWQSSNLSATGTDGTNNRYCKPEPAFYTNKDVVCLNMPVIFRDNSSVGLVQNRTWTFQDGTPATSTDVSQEVRFSTAGWKTVTLSVSNAKGTNTLTSTKAVFVSNASVAQSAPYLESFTDPNVIGDTWLVKNLEENQTAFEIVSNVGYTDKNCLKLNGSDSQNGKTLKDGNGDIDIMISPAFNLAGKNGWQISYKISVASKTTNQAEMNETFKLEYTSNCGGAWLTYKEYSKADLINAGYNGGTFVPTSEGQWKNVVIPVTNSLAKDNIRFRWTYTSSSKSNNLYFDDFKIAPADGIEQLPVNVSSVDVFPNPVTQQSVLSFDLTTDAAVSISLTDVTGKVVSAKQSEKYSIGSHSLHLNEMTNGLSHGMYLLNLQIGTNSVTRKVIID